MVQDRIHCFFVAVHNLQDAFWQAGLIQTKPALNPCDIKSEVVFSDTAQGTQDGDEDLSDLFGHEVKDGQNDQGTRDVAEGPNGVETTLSDGEELEETVKQRILPDPGEPTASQREDHRA